MTFKTQLESIGQYSARFFSDAVGMGAFVLVSGFVSTGGGPLRQLSAFVAIGLLILVTACFSGLDKRRLAAALLLSSWVIFGDPLTAPIGFAASWCLISSRSILARAVLVAALIRAITPQVPELRVPLQKTAELISSLGADGLRAGPTPLGLQSWAILILAGVVSLRAKGGWRPAVALILLSTALVIEHALSFPIPEKGTSEAASIAFSQLPPLLIALSLIGACLVPWKSESRDLVEPAVRNSLTAFAFIGLATAGVLWSPLTRTPSEQTKVCVWNEGGIDWNRPQYGNYNPYGGGMFGMLPLYLEQDDIQFSVASGDSLRAEDLAGKQVLMLINCQRVWSPDERSVIREFMQGGGSTLVLGDHTNVFMLRDGFNSLLTEYGIEFRFDSAYPLAQPMQSCTTLAHHSVTRRPKEFRLIHAIGASLDCSPAVSPIATGRYVLSDEGYDWNVQGSYLGNYSYEAGELLGDVDLAVWRDVGRGKLCVYGDTAAFQNSGLVVSYQDHVLPLFRWLGLETSWFERRPARILIGLVWLLAAAYGLSRRSRPALLPSFAGGVCLALLVIDLRVQLIAGPKLGPKHVLIDYSSIPLTGHYAAKFNDIGPLYLNLRRSGLLGIASERQRVSWQDARAIVFIDPSKEFDSGDVEELMAYEEQGGKVILCVDGDRTRSAQPLLERHGVEVAPIPLGPVPKVSRQRREARQPRMRNAWPIQGTEGEPMPSEMSPLIRSGSHVTAAYLPHGAGGLVLIADARFFSSKNIEGLWGHWPGSVQFVYLLMRDFLGADPSNVTDRFPSPEKPR